MNTFCLTTVTPPGSLQKKQKHQHTRLPRLIATVGKHQSRSNAGPVPHEPLAGRGSSFTRPVMPRPVVSSHLISPLPSPEVPNIEAHCMCTAPCMNPPSLFNSLSSPIPHPDVQYYRCRPGAGGSVLYWWFFPPPKKKEGKTSHKSYMYNNLSHHERSTSMWGDAGGDMCYHRLTQQEE